MIIDRNTGEEFTPLQLMATNIDGSPTGGKFLVYDSPLSEFAAVGFEYGYTVGNPDAFVMWEANSATSSTALSRSSTSSSAPARPSGAAIQPGAAAAARSRRPGPRPHLRPHRTLPAAVGGGFDDDRDALDAVELLPFAAPPRPRRDSASADRVHAEIDVAP
ncbi:transketolase, pyrimidine binding domain protein [Mycobacterium xenopi 4042]|uniref:Transketolase, pyrimidine binding domain protein n=1 Tax=Mycobacterium xenopi 4042 TaxID=1299334 RepID=X8E0D0_MYCXE|nr:transketolase, pyrimidine binding domain protein [Mycobacterium xenopi 4042]